MHSEKRTVSSVMRIRTLPLCIGSVCCTSLLLGAGWLWARLTIATFKQKASVMTLRNLPYRSDYQFWGISVPCAVTGNLAIFVAVLTLFLLWRRRDSFSLVALTAYFLMLAFAWFFVFMKLEFQAFD